MDIHDVISADLEENLKCSSCKNYLSHFPVSLCSNNQNICGRCEIPEGTFSLENEAFQTICQGLKFPCIYSNEGCCARLFPNEVPKHEKTCQYKPVRCIIRKPNQCDWKVTPSRLTPHLHEEHSDLFLQNGEFEMDLTSSEEDESLLEFKKQILVFKRKFDCISQVLYCFVKSGPAKFNCQLSLKSGGTTILHDFQSSSTVELSLVPVNNGSTKISGKISIIGDDYRSKPDPGEINKQLLSLLKCSVCFQFATSPVYRCRETNGLFCNLCAFDHYTKCTSCSGQGLLLDPIEIISQLVEYPCPYREKGCLLTFNQQQYSSHICEYRTRRCPLRNYNSCEWTGSQTEFMDHISDNHAIALTFSDTIFELKWDDTNGQGLFIKFADRLFLLTFSAQKTRISFNVEKIGTFKGNFRYDIDIVDQQNQGKKLSVGKLCPLWDEQRVSSYLEKEQVRSFVTKRKTCVKFKLHIFLVH